MPESARDRTPKFIQLGIQGLIVYSIVTLALETMPELAGYRAFFRYSEIVVVALFTIEYVVYWMLSDDRLRYPFRFMSLVDLLAILPFYLRLGIDLRAFRALRLLRIFRILKLGRYSSALQTLGEAFRRAGPELSSVGIVAGVAVLISAVGLYYAENPAQPEVYSSIPASLWWAVVTLTTVGYGDVYPITVVGKIIASCVMFMGVGLIALPAGILSSTLTEIFRERRNAADHTTQ